MPWKTCRGMFIIIIIEVEVSVQPRYGNLIEDRSRLASQCDSIVLSLIIPMQCSMYIQQRQPELSIFTIIVIAVVIFQLPQHYFITELEFYSHIHKKVENAIDKRTIFNWKFSIFPRINSVRIFGLLLSSIIFNYIVMEMFCRKNMLGGSFVFAGCFLQTSC